jgi:SNF2 family DNA or RNA helicase
MISTRRRDTSQGRSRFGWGRTWNPALPAARHSSVGEWQWRETHIVQTADFIAATPQHSDISAFSTGLPVAERIETWTAGDAASLAIGWFDTEKFQEWIQSLRESESETRLSFGKTPLSEQEDFIRRLAAALQPPLSALYAPNGVLNWPAPLLDYQREGVTALLSHRELLLADDMGLGKSIQAIAALRILWFREAIQTALLVCPASLLAQWRREFAKWAPELKVITLAGSPAERGSLWQIPAHIRLISYETLRADVLDVADSPALRLTWGVVALDEASRIKNRESAIALACKRLPRVRRWALTGTPLENSVDDIRSLLEFLQGDPSRPYRASTGGTLAEQLRRVQLRRRKADVLTELPPKQVIEIELELGPAQRAAYDRAEKEGLYQLRAAGTSLTITHVLELIVRLKQLCNIDPASGESAKLIDIAQRLRTLAEEGHRALVFSQFTDATFGIERAARSLSEFHPLLYTGTMSLSQKSAAIDTFLTDPRRKVLLLSLRSGGVGLNLQAASYVFHLDRWWNPAIEEQADSRAHRMGQTYPVTVFRYTCADTIEARIDEKLREKRKLFSELVDDISLDLSTTLSEAEIFSLFGMSPSRSVHRTP